MVALKHLVLVSAIVLVVVTSCGRDNQVSPADTVPPNPPVGVGAVLEDGNVAMVTWSQNAEVDLAGYKIYRSSNQDGPFGPITARTVVCPWFYASVPPMDATYFKVTAVDQSGNESAYSQIVQVYVSSRDRSQPKTRAGR
jgi:fibronectin type 3 domain-containing protein